eukprot:511010_1
MALRRIMKELQDIDQNDLPPNIQSIAPASDDSFLELYALITGPENTPYAGGNFLLFIEIPQNYPFKRPKLKFETEIYHPNIHETGTLDTRHVGIDDWSPVWTIVKALIMVVERLKDPDTEGRSYGSEVNFEAAHLHRTSRWMYNKRANDMAVKYADAPPQNIDVVGMASIADMKCVYHAKTQQIVVEINLDHTYHCEYANYKDHIKYMSIKITLDDDEEYSNKIEINRTNYSIVMQKELEYGRNIKVKAWTEFDSTEWDTLNDESSNPVTKHISVPVLEKPLCIALIEGYFHDIATDENAIKNDKSVDKIIENKASNLRKELLKLSKPKLIKECKKYKVSTTGSKNDMIQRLLTADAKKPKKTRSKKKSKKTKKKKKKKSSKSEDSGEAQTVWKKLSKQESSINWYLLKLDGKPGKTTNLTFVKEGDGGAAEIADFLKEESKAVYFGLLKCVTTDDSKSVRGKFIYLRFIGSGVKSITKAKLTTSLGKIDDQFPCKHLSLDINEKCADDLTPKKLAVELLRVGGAHKPDKMVFGPNQEIIAKDLYKTK